MPPVTTLLQVLLAVSTFLGFVNGVQRVNSNPKGNFATGFTDGYIHSGDYAVVVPKGNDEVKREVVIEGPGVRDSLDMVFNTNTMVFSDWDGAFKLGEDVYTDKPGTLYYVRSDKKCVKKKYQDQGSEIRVVSRETVDRSTCEAIRTKVDEILRHFLKYPFKYMLPEPDLKLEHAKGYPGGDYVTGQVYGTVYVGQHTVQLPSGDSDVERMVTITAPGVSDTITLKVNANTKIYGKWDGSFYLGDTVYTTEPRTLVVEDAKGDCVKKKFEDHGSSISVAYTTILKKEECFFIKSKVYADMQNLIGNPKLLAKDEKPSPPPQNPPPITVTSTVVYPNADQTNPASTASGYPSQTTHTVTLQPGPAQNTNQGGSGNVQGSRPAGTPANTQQNMPGSSKIPSDPPLQILSPPGAGLASNVHISTVTSQHPDVPSVRATSVVQSRSLQQTTSSPVMNPVVSNLLVPAQNQPNAINIVNSAPLSAQTPQILVDPSGQVQLLVAADPNPIGSTILLQPGSNPSINLQPNPSEQSNAMNIHSNNVNVQPDGSLQVGGGSLILQGLDPNAELVLPEGNIRVGRSVDQQTSSQPNPGTYQIVSYPSQLVSQPTQVVSIQSTNSGNTPSSDVKTIIVPQNGELSHVIQHSTTVNIPQNTPYQENVLQGNQQNNNVNIKSNVIVKNPNTQQRPTLYFLQGGSPATSSDSPTKQNSNSPTLLNIIPSGSSGPTVLTLQSNGNQSPGQRSFSQNNQIQNSRNPKIVLTTSSQGQTIQMNQDKPVVLNLQPQGAPSGSQGGSNVHFNIGNSGSSILINSPTSKPASQSGSSGPVTKTDKENNYENMKGKTNSVVNLMKDLNLPSPVNNLIVNIAENTNFNKKK